MKTLVIGSGAIGSTVAGILAQSGFDVHLACKTKDIANKINKIGVAFAKRKHKIYQPVKAYSCVSNTPANNYDYVLLATKSFDIEEPVSNVIDKLSPDGLIVSLQDGYCEEKLARIAGSNRVVGAVVGWGATFDINTGIAQITSKGEMVIGKLDGSDDPRLDNLQYMLNHIAPTVVVDNINAHIYSKLIINSCVTTLGAITGLNVGELIINSRLRNIFLQVINESIWVADVLKIEIPDYAGKLNYYKLVRGKSIYHRIRKHLYILIFGFKYRKVKSSGLQSLERGEQTEIDLLNGYIVDKATEMGIDLPVNRRLVVLIKEIEQNKRPITPHNLSEDLFSVH
jgi:2-dehydropantoate 2-reductase